MGGQAHIIDFDCLTVALEALTMVIILNFFLSSQFLNIYYYVPSSIPDLLLWKDIKKSQPNNMGLISDGPQFLKVTSYNFIKKANLLNIKRILNSQFKFFLIKFLPAKLSLSISLFSFIDYGIKKKKY